MFKRVLLSAAGAVMLLTTPVLAQVPPGDAPPPRAAGPIAQAQHRLQQAHDRLAITAAQQPQWDAVVALLRDNAAVLRDSPARQAIRSARLDGVQELRAAAELARQRADGMQRLIPAVESLYQVLSPEQRQVADREIDRVMHRGPGHRRG